MEGLGSEAARGQTLIWVDHAPKQTW